MVTQEFTPETEEAPFTPETVEERAERARDLQRQAAAELGEETQGQEWTVRDVTPLRKLYVLYSMQTGERIAVPKFVFDQALTRTISGTRKPAWTARKALAPKEVVGKLMCLFHPDAPESGFMEELGIVPSCNANELRSEYSRRMHAQNKHPTMWAMWREFEQKRERDTDRGERHIQTSAMLELAASAAAQAKASAKPAGKATAAEPSAD